MKPKHIYKRPCRNCDTMFIPDGKYQKLCERCKCNIRKGGTIKTKKTMRLRKLEGQNEQL